MENLLGTIDDIAAKMKEKGYRYFNIRGGNIGTDFKTGLTSYLRHANITKAEPAFPIYAGSGVAATNPGEPFSWASFTIAEDIQKGLRIGSMTISMYECFDGPLRTSLDLKLKSVEDVPTRQEAAKLINEKWQALYAENKKRWNNAVNIKDNKANGRKL